MNRGALENLIEAVEAGEATISIMGLGAAVFRPESAGGLCTFHHVARAFEGSLDAAKALHEAVLPGWGLEMLRLGEGVSSVTLWPSWPERDQGATPSLAKDEEPARAWLLAILRALQSQTD